MILLLLVIDRPSDSLPYLIQDQLGSSRKHCLFLTSKVNSLVRLMGLAIKAYGCGKVMSWTSEKSFFLISVFCLNAQIDQYSGCNCSDLSLFFFRILLTLACLLSQFCLTSYASVRVSRVMGNFWSYRPTSLLNDSFQHWNTSVFMHWLKNKLN